MHFRKFFVKIFSQTRKLENLMSLGWANFIEPKILKLEKFRNFETRRYPNLIKLYCKVICKTWIFLNLWPQFWSRTCLSSRPCLLLQKTAESFFSFSTTITKSKPFSAFFQRLRKVDLNLLMSHFRRRAIPVHFLF